MATITEQTALAVTPFSLKDEPSLIERIWPAQKISVEAQKERKANLGQTLTALGSYWKGRKPLILVRACVLGALLPATGNEAEDVAIFEALLQIDDEAFSIRDVTTKVGEIAAIATEHRLLDAADLSRYFTIKGRRDPDPASEIELGVALTARKLVWRKDLPEQDRLSLVSRTLALLPYAERVRRSLRPEELGEEALASKWGRINRHLGTRADSIPELVHQLGVMRYGRTPKVADTFAGGGSIPFEAARVGCDVYASDLNPAACMLTWGALNVVGAPPAKRRQLEDEQKHVAEEVNRRVTELGIEHDDHGNRAKAYLYCLETRCPSSGWLVPMLSSLVVSKMRNVVVRLVPDPAARRYDIAIDTDVDAATLKTAELGTVREGYLVHVVDGTEHRTSIKTIRGDQRSSDGSTTNSLRRWERGDFVPRPDDILQERLFCIHWMKAETLGAARQETYFTAPNGADLARERRVIDIVGERLADWQQRGLVPDMMIEPGDKTDEPIRTRGWTHWHHLFNARQLLLHALYGEHRDPLSTLLNMKALDWQSRLCRWHNGWEKPEQVFYNQALNTNILYGCRAWTMHERSRSQTVASAPLTSMVAIVNAAAKDVAISNDVYITDPPYADAVNYHEITEFFIAWLRRDQPEDFQDWTWDSRRPLAIKGDGEEFRRDMVTAYRAMAEHMNDDGLQIVMFTHQSGSVWADMAQIFWGAGLQVQAAWYIATETTTDLKKGGYVQGTVILVLRKRGDGESGYEDEIAQEVRAEVARQIDTLVGLNQQLKGTGRIENLFEDADLQMAGYAAALRVLTGYTRIDGRDMTAEASRPRKKSEQGFVERIIDYAVQVANEHMVPTGLTSRLWQGLSGTERFYLKMIDLEAARLSKLDNYQNFARAFRVPDYGVLMADLRPNAARLKSAADFRRRIGFEIPEFGEGLVRAVLYGIWELSAEADPDTVTLQLREMVDSYLRRREDLIEIAEYIASQRGREDQKEGRYAALLANIIRNEKL